MQVVRIKCACSRPSFKNTRLVRCSIAGLQDVPSISKTESSESDDQLEGLSYAEQYDRIFSKDIDPKKVIPKPDRVRQQFYEGTQRVAFTRNVYAKEKSTEVTRKKNLTDKIYIAFIASMHLLCFALPFTFSWSNVALFGGTYFLTGCLGITLSFHRQLSHKSFRTPRWLEYFLAYCGALAVQGDPKEWVSTHRYHHMHCETPLDPHSSYEGFWWSHCGWILENNATLERVGDRSNLGDMDKDPFYNHLEKWYGAHVALMFVALYAIGGFGAVVWGGAARIVWVWHVTWLVNSACHLWGRQTYNTGDLSMNNWWVGLLAWGEGWHNNHHAFEFSARHGLEWWQFDMTWQLICLLNAAGLADNIKLPTEKQKQRLAF